MIGSTSRRVFFAVAVALAGSSCKVTCTDTGRLPSAEVEPAEVEVRTERRTVEVPQVEVRDLDREERAEAERR